MDKLITIGQITKNQGNKGEVRVLPMTDFTERFQVLDKVCLEKGEKTITKEIQDVWYHKQFVIIKFKGVDDIGSAFELQDYLIKIKEENLVPLLEDEYYIYQIKNFQVQTLQGKNLGKLKDVLPTGGADIFLVAGDEKEYMIPASKEIIKSINMSEEKIIVDPFPGLLDL